MSKNLLVADDSVTIQKVVGIVFAHEDYRVTAAGSGEEALRIAREHRPDIVLADAAMPGMDGYDLCAALKDDPRLADVPVLILAGTSAPLDETRARAARADGHVVKPFDSQTLLSRVRELVEGVTPEPMPMPYPRTTPAAPVRAVAAALTPAPGPALTPSPVTSAGAPPRRNVPPPLPPPGHPSRLAAARAPGLPVPSVRTAGVRPPPPGAARPVAVDPRPAAVPPPSPRPQAPPRPAPPPARPGPAPSAFRPPTPAEDDWSDVSAPVAVAPAPRPPARPEIRHPAAGPGDDGEAALRLALSQASREVVERIAWEVIPQLAEVIIREHVERLVNERQKR